MSALANWYPGHSVLNFCVTVAVTVMLVTATAWMLSLFLNRQPAIRHWVLLSALAASLASPFLALGFIASGRSFINVPLLIAEGTAPELPDELDPSRNLQAEHGHARLLDEPAQSVAPETFLPTHRTGPARAESVRDHVVAAGPNFPTVNPTTEPSDPFRSAVVGILLMWLCGTLVVILGLFRGVLFLRRLRQSAGPITDAELDKALDEARRLGCERCLPAIGVSSLARSPMVAGLFRPIIVIPRSLLGAISGHQLRDILTHEIAHVERRDNLVVLLQAIARAAFWPIPFLHLLNRELERAREEICDNHVLACRDAVSYGETLLRVAHLACETEMPVGTVGILHWRGKLEERIFGLIHKGRSKMTRMDPLIALGVLALFLSTTAILCGTTIIAAQPPQTATHGIDRVTASSDDDSGKAQVKTLVQKRIDAYFEEVRRQDFATLVKNLNKNELSPTGAPILDGGSVETFPDPMFKVCLVDRRLGKLCELIQEMPVKQQARTARMIFDQKFEDACEGILDHRQKAVGMSDGDRMIAWLRRIDQLKAASKGLFLVFQFCPPAELVECVELWEERNAREDLKNPPEPLFVLNLYVLTLVERLNAGTIDSVLEEAMVAEAAYMRARMGELITIVDTEALKSLGVRNSWELEPHERKAISRPLGPPEKPLSADKGASRLLIAAWRICRFQSRKAGV